MGNEGSYVALGLKVWKAQIDRADKLFGSLSSEEVQHEIAPGLHDAMLSLLGLGERLHQMSPSYRIRISRTPPSLRMNRFAKLGTPSMLNCRRVLKKCRGLTGCSGTLPCRRKISRKMLRAIASLS